MPLRSTPSDEVKDEERTVAGFSNRFTRRQLIVGAIVAITSVMCIRLLVRAVTHFELDLDVYRWGGHALATGAPLYGPDARVGLPFTYTPIAALLFVPIGLIPHTMAQLVWTSALLIALYVFVRESVRYAAPRLSGNASTLTTIAVLGAALWLEPIRHNFGLGQINILLATAILLDLRGRTGRIPTGVLIGIAAAVKLTPLIFVAYLLVTRRWRAAVTAVAAFAAATTIGALATWDQSWEYWTKHAFDASHVGGIPYVANQSLYGVLTRLLEGVDNADAIYRPVAALIGIAGLALAARVHKRSPMLGDITCAFVGLLLSPISWSHHWVWVIPAMVWFALHLDAPRWGRVAVAAGFAFFTMGPIWWVPREHDAELTHNAWQQIAANSYLGVALALLGAIAWVAYKYVPGRASGLPGWPSPGGSLR